MNGFIEWIEKLNAIDTRVRAVLRRSLAFDPGRFVPAYPYVEPFIRDEDNSWRREVYYLVAGLWAAHWREGRTGVPMSIGKATAFFDREKRRHLSKEERRKVSRTERRFIILLDADSDQLPHRLRQMLALLKEECIDFKALLKGLLYWNDDQKRTQTAWARDFYRSLNRETGTEINTEKENSE